MSMVNAEEPVVALAHYDAACRAIAEAKAVDEVKHIRDSAIAMRAYARQAKNKGLEADAWEIRQRAERRIAELMEAHKDTGGFQRGGDRRSKVANGPLKPITIQEVGIDQHLADRARKLAKLDAEEFERRLADGRARIQDVTERVRVDLIAPTAHVGQNSGDNEWFTPKEFIEPARKVLGAIDLDPASSEDANTVVKAGSFYTKDDDGLARKWKGRIWMNPPYAQPLIEQFAEKLAVEVDSGAVTAAVVLVNNATETNWFRTIAERASAVCFPAGRVRFWHPDKPTAAPLQGQAILYIGSKPTTFHARFSELGIVWIKP
jgi:phage N-6-adenine-methyltransferase